MYLENSFNYSYNPLMLYLAESKHRNFLSFSLIGDGEVYPSTINILSVPTVYLRTIKHEVKCLIILIIQLNTKAQQLFSTNSRNINCTAASFSAVHM